MKWIKPILLTFAITMSVAVTGWSVPPVPTNAYIEVIETDLGMYIHWADVIGETGYRIYRTKNPADGYQEIITLPANTTNYTDGVGLSWDTIYYYALEAYDAGGNNGAAALDARTPPLPVTFEAEDMPDAQGEIRLFWTVLDTTVKYKIYIETFAYSNEGNITPITNLPGGVNSFVIGELQGGNPVVDGTPYYVCVTPVRNYRGVDIENRSIVPQEIIPIDDEPPPVVTNLIFNKEINGWGRLGIEWQKPSVVDLMSYNVYRSETPFSSVQNAELITNVATNTVELFIGNSYAYYYGVTVLDIHSNENAYVNPQRGSPAPVTTFLNPTNEISYVNEQIALQLAFDSSDVASVLYQYKTSDEMLWYTIVSTAYGFSYDWVMTNLEPERTYSVRAYAIDMAGNIEGDLNGNKQLDESEGTELEVRQIYYDNTPPEFDVGFSGAYTNIRGYVDLMISNSSGDIAGVKYYLTTNGADYFYFAEAVTEDMKFTNLNISYMIGHSVRLRAVAVDICGNYGTNDSAAYYVDPRACSISNLTVACSSRADYYQNGDTVLIAVMGSGLTAICDLTALGVETILTDNIAVNGVAEFEQELNNLPDVSTAAITITVFDAAGDFVAETNTVVVDLVREIKNLKAYTRLLDSEWVVEFNSGAEPQSLTLYVYDLSGRVILTRELDDFERDNQSYTLRYDPGELGRGTYVYYLIASYANGTVQQKSGKLMVLN